MLINQEICSKTINKVVKKYNILGYYPELVDLLRIAYPKKQFSDYSKYEIHKQLSDLAIKHYTGEEVLKFKLLEEQLNKKNIVAAFEVNVNKSRLDFLTINGYSTSYEIKSKLDNLDKLSKQISDYLLAFDYNILVIDESHLSKAELLLPECYGIWIYKNGQFKKHKAATLNTKVDPLIQLGLLTKKELNTYFKKEDGQVDKIMLSQDATNINTVFKTVLKDRYRKRWQFLQINWDEILPLDSQFFFNSNILPSYIYQ